MQLVPPSICPLPDQNQSVARPRPPAWFDASRFGHDLRQPHRRCPPHVVRGSLVRTRPGATTMRPCGTKLPSSNATRSNPAMVQVTPRIVKVHTESTELPSEHNRIERAALQQCSITTLAARTIEQKSRQTSNMAWVNANGTRIS